MLNYNYKKYFKDQSLDHLLILYGSVLLHVKFTYKSKIGLTFVQSANLLFFV